MTHNEIWTRDAPSDESDNGLNDVDDDEEEDDDDYVTFTWDLWLE